MESITQTRRTKKQIEEYVDYLCENYVKESIKKNCNCVYAKNDYEEKLNDIINLSDSDFKKKYYYSSYSSKSPWFASILFTKSEMSFQRWIVDKTIKDKTNKLSIFKKMEIIYKNSNPWDETDDVYNDRLAYYLRNMIKSYDNNWNDIISYFKEEEIMIK
jgi:hypothetical protein